MDQNHKDMSNGEWFVKMAVHGPTDKSRVYSTWTIDDLSQNMLDKICQPSNIKACNHRYCMELGARVVPGEDWHRYQKEEKGDMGEGTITRNQAGYVDVKWDTKGQKNNYCMRSSRSTILALSPSWEVFHFAMRTWRHSG